MSKRGDEAVAVQLALWEILSDPAQRAVVIQALLPQGTRLEVVTNIVKAADTEARTAILQALREDPAQGVRNMATEALRPRPILHKLEGKTR
jgi:hypothetical protein